MTWILFIFIYSSGLREESVATTNQEFSSLENCQAAGKAVKEKVYKSNWVCVRK